MKKNNLIKILVLIGLMGSLQVCNASAMNDKGIFDIRENVQLINENEKSIKDSEGNYLTPLEFIKSSLKKAGIKCNENCEFFNRGGFGEEDSRVLNIILSNYLENNVENYDNIIQENVELRREIENELYYVKSTANAYFSSMEKEYKEKIDNGTADDYEREEYRRIIEEKNKIKEENQKNKENNERIHERVVKLKEKLEDEQHDRCEYLYDMRQQLSVNLVKGDNKRIYLGNKNYKLSDEFTDASRTGFWLLNIYYNRDKFNYMKNLEKILETAEGKNENCKFENMKQRSKDAYNMFLITKKLIEVMNNNPRELGRFEADSLYIDKEKEKENDENIKSEDNNLNNSFEDNKDNSLLEIEDNNSLKDSFSDSENSSLENTIDNIKNSIKTNRNDISESSPNIVNIHTMKTNTNNDIKPIRSFEKSINNLRRSNHTVKINNTIKNNNSDNNSSRKVNINSVARINRWNRSDSYRVNNNLNNEIENLRRSNHTVRINNTIKNNINNSYSKKSLASFKRRNESYVNRVNK